MTKALKKVGRRPKVDWKKVVRAFRSGKVKNGAEAARLFGCSRVRINQILGEHAPDLLPGKVKPVSASQERAVRHRQAKMRLDTADALKTHPTITLAAQALGLTSSGLYSRMRRLNITEVAAGAQAELSA
jgi:transcriptional regulator with GAF, ATPase, and Fis domain